MEVTFVTQGLVKLTCENEEQEDRLAPDEILAIAFNYLQTGSDVIKCSLVCWKWRRVILSRKEMRTVRMITYMNSIYFDVLHRPLKYHSSDSAWQSGPKVANFLSAVLEANCFSPPPLSLEHEVRRLADISLHRASAGYKGTCQFQSLIKFLLKTNFFPLAMELVAEVSLLGNTLVLSELDSSRSYLEIAVAAYAAGKHSIYAEASARAISYFEDELPQRLQENSEESAVNMTRAKMHNYIDKENPSLALELLPFVTNRRENCRAALLIATFCSKIGEMEQANNALSCAMMCTDSFGVAEMDLYLDLISVCLLLEKKNDADVLSQEMKKIFLEANSDDQQKTRFFYFEAQVLLGEVDLAVRFIEDQFMQEVSMVKILARNGYTDFALGFSSKVRGMIDKAECYIAIAMEIKDDFPDRAFTILNDIARKSLTEVHLWYDVSRVVSLRFEIVKGLQSLGRMQEATTCLEETLAIDIASFHGQESEKNRALACIGSNLCRLDRIDEGRMYFNRAIKSALAKNVQWELSRIYLAEIADLQVKAGLVYDGRITYLILRKLLIAREDIDMVSEISFELTSSILAMGG